MSFCKPALLRDAVPVEARRLRIAMLSIHSCPIGELGTRDTGGMNVYIRELAQKIGARGHSVDVFTRLHDPKDHYIGELYENVRLIHLKAGGVESIEKLAIYPHLPDFYLALETFRESQGLHYDLIHSHYWLSGRVGSWVRVSWNIPHFLMFHTLGVIKNLTGVGETEPELRIATEKRLAKTCDRIIAATAREKVDLRRYYGADPKTIAVVPCGVNLERFRPLDKADARKRLGFDSNEKILLFVGRFSPIKGIERLLGAMRYLTQIQRVRLIIIGGDGYGNGDHRALRRLSGKLGILEKVIFGGRVEQENLPWYYSAADILVIPSHHESFGLVALEAMACGTPVLATKVGAMDTLIREGETGCIVTNADPHSLSDKIQAFLSNRNTPPPSTDAIRASIAKFDWSNIADAIIEEYGTAVRPQGYHVLKNTHRTAHRFKGLR